MITLTEKGLVIQGETIYIDASLIDKKTGDIPYSLLAKVHFACRNNLVASAAKPKRHLKYVKTAYAEFDHNLKFINSSKTVWDNKFVGTDAGPSESIV